MKRVAIRAAAVIVAVLATWSPAAAVAARSKGKIVYLKKPISIRAISADGKLDKPFAPVRSGAQSTPLWSPDGRMVLFHRDQPHALVVVTLGKGRPKVLYQGQDEIDEAPVEYAWSANGRMVAFTHGVLSGSSGPRYPLSVMQTDGTGRRELPLENVGGLNWLADNRRIAFTRDTGSGAAMWTIDITTGAQVKLFDIGPTDANFRLSPDGRTFVFDRGGSPQLWVRRIDGSGTRAVVKRTNAFGGAWSPNGRELAFLLRKSNRGPTDIYTVRLDGSRLKRLTKHGKALSVHWGRGSLRKNHRL